MFQNNPYKSETLLSEIQLTFGDNPWIIQSPITRCGNYDEWYNYIGPSKDRIKPARFYSRYLKIRLMKQAPVIFCRLKQDYTTCLDAMKIYGNHLAYVETQYKTEELCNEALNSGGRGLSYMPPDMITVEIVKKSLQNGDFVYFIPKCFRTEEIYMYAVSMFPYNWEYIPDKYKTNDRCLQILAKDPEMMRYMPSDFYTWVVSKYINSV